MTPHSLKDDNDVGDVGDDDDDDDNVGDLMLANQKMDSTQVDASFIKR